MNHFSQNTSLDRVQEVVRTVLSQDLCQLFDDACLPSPLDEAARYAMANGGKRVRPLLVLCAFLVLRDERIDRLDDVKKSMMAVELIHGYSLVHDDLPCMDDDDLRRGLPTCHVRYGYATALLAGDVLQSLAFECVADCQDMRLLRTLAMGARRMVAGQQLDLNGECQALCQDELEQIHKDKTGALIETAVLLGGLCAQATTAELDRLHNYAVAVGLAFQVQDDVLDVVADTQTLGKPVGSDDKLAKSTYVKLLGVRGASDYATKLFLQARQAVAGFGEGNLLLQMVDWLERRQH